MSNWAEEHPIQMKAVEIGLGTLFSLASTVVASWATAKINAYFKKKKEQKSIEEAQEEAEEKIDEFLDEKFVPYMNSAIDIATDMAIKYGKDWQNIPEAQDEANELLSEANPF